MVRLENTHRSAMILGNRLSTTESVGVIRPVKLTSRWQGIRWELGLSKGLYRLPMTHNLPVGLYQQKITRNVGHKTLIRRAQYNNAVGTSKSPLPWPLLDLLLLLYYWVIQSNLNSW
jgi:hypothetical protein